MNKVKTITLEKPAQIKVINLIPDKTDEVSESNLKGFVKKVGVIFTAVYAIWFLMIFLLLL